MRQHIVLKKECAQRDEGCGDQVWQQQAPEAHPAVEHGDDLGVYRHPRSKEDHRYEDKHRGEQRGEVGDEIKVIVENDGIERCLFLDEVINLLREVEYHRYAQYEHKRKDECPEELPDDVPVQYAGGNLLQTLSDILRTVSSFHGPNVPSSIRALASLTRLK